MAETDDKMNGVENGGDIEAQADSLPPESTADSQPAAADAEPEPDAKDAPDVKDASDAKKPSDGKSGFAGELVAVSLKAIAVVLSLVVLIVGILSVAMPLSAMRVYNKLGMYERALESGERYIRTRLEGEDAYKTNSFGEYRALTFKPKLSDADMVEALDVCIGLSDKLMRKYADDDKKSAAYFANELDKYIRIYFSLNDEIAISRDKTQKMQSSFAPALRPIVYDYKHTLMTLDYAARVYGGDAKKLENMLYDANGSVPSDKNDQMFVVSAADQSYNLFSVQVTPETSWNTQMILLDRFVDYVDQLSTYLAIREQKFGLTKPISEVEANEKYMNALRGDEFSMLVTPQGGYTKLYDELMGKSGNMDISARSTGLMFKYTRLAYDFDTRGDAELQLHRLYWLRILTTAADRLWNMQMLLFRSRAAFGQYSGAISDEYYTDAFKYARCVVGGYEDDGAPIWLDLTTQYNNAMTDWLRNFS